MNWDAIQRFGQVLGSLAVFITLGYLAIQVRHARDAVARTARQARTDANIRLFLARASDESSRRVAKNASALGTPAIPFVAAMQQVGVTAEDAYAEYFEQFAWWCHREHSLSNVDQLSAGERAAVERTARFHYGTQPTGRLWYENVNTKLLNADAVRYIDNLLAQPN